MNTATVTMKDYKGQTSTIRIPGVTTLAKAKQIADWIKGHTDAAVVGYGVSMGYAGDSTDTGKYDRVLQALRLLFKDELGKTRSFSIPAPRDEDVNDDQEPISDLPEDVMDLLKAVGAAKTLTYEGGGLRSRLPRSEARSREVTGV